MTTSYLTAPQAEKKQRTYRYMCEVVSNELELDHNGIPVPKDVKTIELVVTEPTLAAIALGVRFAIASLVAIGWLSGYRLVAHWIPSDCTEF